VIDRKTRLFYSVAGSCGTGIAYQTRTIDAMAKSRTAMGHAFQMVDGPYRHTGPEERSAKPVGSDLRAGIP